MGYSSNAKVYHNSIYGRGGIHWEDGTLWAYVKNNIVHITDGNLWPFRSYSGQYSRPRDMVVENNNWFNSGSGAKRVKWGPADGPTDYEYYDNELAAWQALTGDVGDNAIFTDPLYHSVGNDDVNLTDSSPGKDTGLDLDIDTDYTGASRIGNHDMGALEFDPNPAVPGAATTPSPADAATGQDINVDISWTADDDADDHDVYFGTNPSNVLNATKSDGQFKGNQVGVTYNPGTLEYATPYYWRIDEVNDTLPATTKGTVWTFTTKTSASGAAGWYNASWLYRKKIIIQATNVDSDLTNFPLYVPISSDADIGASAKSDGSDVRFTAADGQTLLDFHMPYWDVTASVADANVFVECDPNDSSPAAAWIYIYYGNAAASDDQDEAGTWDASYAGVWHLDETAGAAVDSDGTNDGTYTVDLPDEQAGILYYCQDFDGVGDYVDLGSTISVADQDFTVSAWFKTTDATVGGIFSNFQSGAGDEWFALAVNASGGMDEDAGDIGFGIDDAGTKQGAETTGAGYNDNAWHHICGKREGTNLELFVDGGSVDVNAIGAYGDIDGTLAPRIGTFGNIGDTHSFIGQIDEVRISTTARHDDWIKFEYYNIFNGDNELDWGLEEVDAAPGSKNMIIIIGA
ncbi:MAG: DUF2341 domain-containing protein [Gammaproteobacteria bacterium]|nr:DUF2341 domain-containing protein [Gammaproteobacteria bacterium]